MTAISEGAHRYTVTTVIEGSPPPFRGPARASDVASFEPAAPAGPKEPNDRMLSPITAIAAMYLRLGMRGASLQGQRRSTGLRRVREMRSRCSCSAASWELGLAMWLCFRLCRGLALGCHYY